MFLRRDHAADLRSLPRDPRADEYPMPSVPDGWYALLRSKQLRPGKVINLHYFGRALIAFRGADGTVAVRDAYCPHYGAHLGVGGKVIDGTVECPFHGWRFGADGRCTHAPFAVRTPKVGIGGLPVREHSGLVFVYHGATEPLWEVPDIPECTSGDFAAPIDDVCRARIHIQEMRENIVDESHFHFIHDQREPPVLDLRPDGPFAESKGKIHRRVLGRDINNTFDVYMYGPGVMVVRVHGPVLSVTAVALTTPVDGRTSEMRMLYYVRKPDRLALAAPLLKLIFRREALKEVREEVRIWDRKIHQARPVLLPHEKGIKALRKWYAQFYPAPEIPEQAERAERAERAEQADQAERPEISPGAPRHPADSHSAGKAASLRRSAGSSSPAPRSAVGIRTGAGSEQGR